MTHCTCRDLSRVRFPQFPAEASISRPSTPDHSIVVRPIPPVAECTRILWPCGVLATNLIAPSARSVVRDTVIMQAASESFMECGVCINRPALAQTVDLTQPGTNAATELPILNFPLEDITTPEQSEPNAFTEPKYAPRKHRISLKLSPRAATWSCTRSCASTSVLLCCKGKV